MREGGGRAGAADKNSKDEGTCANSLYEARSSLLPKSDKSTARKLHIVYLMNNDAKINNRATVKPIQLHIKRIIYHEQKAYIPDRQRWFSI